LTLMLLTKGSEETEDGRLSTVDCGKNHIRFEGPCQIKEKFALPILMGCKSMTNLSKIGNAARSVLDLL